MQLSLWGRPCAKKTHTQPKHADHTKVATPDERNRNRNPRKAVFFSGRILRWKKKRQGSKKQMPSYLNQISASFEIHYWLHLHPTPPLQLLVSLSEAAIFSKLPKASCVQASSHCSGMGQVKKRQLLLSLILEMHLPDSVSGT